MRHKVMLNGFGYIGRIIEGSSANYAFCRTENKSIPQTINFSDFVKIQEPFVSLVDSYKKVRRKYYPEKDFFLKIK